MLAKLSRSLGTWVFGSLLLFFFMAVFLFAPDSLPAYKQRMLALSCALLAGLFGYFLTGSLELDLDSFKTPMGEGTLKASGSVGLFVVVLLWWFSPLAPIDAGGGVHTVRVAVLGPQGLPVEDAEIWSSLGGELVQVRGGWQFEIPASRLPEDGRITVHAAQRSAFLTGRTELELDPGQGLSSLAVELRPDRSASVRGIVVDPSGEPIGGARVSVMGFPEEAVTSSEHGSFEVAAHAAPLQEVRLRATKPGFAPMDQYHLAGDEPVELRLFPGDQP